MATTLYIRLSADPALPVTWIAREGLASRTGSGLESAAATGAARCVVLAPGSEVLLTRAELPPTQRQRLLQAVPFALEEQLADEVEMLHFAIGRHEPGGALPVAVVARSAIEGWLAQLAGSGLQPQTMFPDTLALPWEPGSWTLLVEPGAALLRTGADAGYAFEPDLLAAALPNALGREARPERIRVFDCRPAGAPELGLESACTEAGVVLQRVPCPAGALAVLADGSAAGGIDLLQGSYSRREQSGRRWRPWIPAAAMLGGLLLVQGGLAGADYLRLAREEERLQARIEQVYRDAFPDTKRIVNPRVQMEHQLAQLRGGKGRQELSDLLTRAGPVLAQAPGLQLKGMRYREGEMELDILLADLATLDRLKQGLTTEALLDATIQNANARGSSVEARLVLRRRAGA